MLRVAGIFLIGLAFGIVGVVLLRSGTPVASRDAVEQRLLDAATSPGLGHLPPRQAVVALGTLEPREGIVQISSPLVGFMIRQVNVREGQLVSAGDLLVELDPAPAETEYQLAVAQRAEAQERQASEIELARQQVATAKLALDQARESRPLELAAQQSRAAVAQARAAQAKRDLERLEELHKLPEPLASAQQLEQQRLLLDAATAEVAATDAAAQRLSQSLDFQVQTAEAQLRAAEQSLALAERGTGVESLNRRVELAQLRRAQTKVFAPRAGTVLSVLAHSGEVVAQQPLLQMAALDQLVCVAEVDVSDVPYLGAKQRAILRSRAFHGAELEGVVERIGSQVAPAGLMPRDPRQPVDRDVSKVVIQLDAAKAARLMNQAGADRRSALVRLQVEVEFPLARSSAAPLLGK